jgi:hypothetical protein
VREIERDGDGARAFGGKPFVAEVAIGAESDAAEGQVVVELAEARLEFGAFDAHPKIADTDGQEFFVFERGPCLRSRNGRGRCGGRGCNWGCRRFLLSRDFHLYILTVQA